MLGIKYCTHNLIISLLYELLLERCYIWKNKTYKPVVFMEMLLQAILVLIDLWKEKLGFSFAKEKQLVKEKFKLIQFL